MASYIDPSFRDSLLRKPHERTSQDLTLINAHLKSLEALSSFRDTTIRSLCKSIRYEKHEANDVLYRTGDVIYNWYILLSGSVFIDGSMYLPRSGFGRRSAGQTHRVHDCLVLETSEMLVIDYPKQDPLHQQSQDLSLDSTVNNTTTTINNNNNNQISTVQVLNSTNHNRNHHATSTKNPTSLINTNNNNDNFSNSTLTSTSNATPTTTGGLNSNDLIKPNNQNNTTPLTTTNKQASQQLLNQRIMIKTNSSDEKSRGNSNNNNSEGGDAAGLQSYKAQLVQPAHAFKAQSIGSSPSKSLYGTSNQTLVTTTTIMTTTTKTTSNKLDRKPSNEICGVMIGQDDDDDEEDAQLNDVDEDHEDLLNNDIIDNKIELGEDDDDEVDIENEQDDEVELDDDDDESDDDDDDDVDDDLHNLNIVDHDFELDAAGGYSSPDRQRLEQLKSICIVTGNTGFKPTSSTSRHHHHHHHHNNNNNNNNIHHHHHHAKINQIESSEIQPINSGIERFKSSSSSKRSRQNADNNHNQMEPTNRSNKLNESFSNTDILNISQQTLSSNTNANNSVNTIDTLDDENERANTTTPGNVMIATSISNYQLMSVKTPAASSTSVYVTTTLNTGSSKNTTNNNAASSSNNKIVESCSSSICSSKSSSILSNHIPTSSTNNLINNSTSNANQSSSMTNINNLTNVSVGTNNSGTNMLNHNEADRMSATSVPASKDMVREVLEKDPKERTDEDIDILFEFMQTLSAFTNLTEPLIRKLCSCMVLGVVDKADTLVLDHNERLDSWAVVLNGHVECIMPDSTVKTYHIGDHFGVSPVLEPVYHQGVMRTKCDDCQFVLVKQNDYYEILNKGKENTKTYYENNRLVMLSELRGINNSTDRTGEIVLRATAEKLIERLVYDEASSLVDPTYIQDFLLTYRVFIDTPNEIASKLYAWFQHPALPSPSTSTSSMSTSSTSSSSSSSSALSAASPSTINMTIRKKVYRIVLEWITNHFNDFETNRELYDFVERFQEQLSKEKMNEQFRVLSIAISTKSKQRTVTVARSKRDEALMFTIQGGWEKGYGIFVAKVERDSKAYELGIRKGDQILEVNGHSFIHITLAQAFDALKASTHSSITLKYNPIGFSEMLLHPEKSPHRNKKNFTNNNKAYLIEYLKQQQNNYHSSLQVPNGGAINSNASSANSSPKIGEESSNLSPQEAAAAAARVSQTGKKSIGSIPPLPPQAHHGMQTSTNSLTPRNKSKDSNKSSHFKLANFSSNSNSNANNSVNTKQPNDSSSSSSNQIKKIFNRFNRKPHSKELEGLAQGDSSAPSLKSITRSPSPSLSNFHHHHSTGGGHSNTSSFSGSILFGKSSAALQQQQNSKLLTNSMSDYVTGLSRNNSATNLNDSTGGQQHSFENSFAKMGLLDQHEFVGKHVLKIYKNDQNFKYLVVHKETSTKEVVMLALNEFNINDEMGSNAYSLCEVSVDQDRVIKQKRLPDQMNNLAERLPLNARYYLKCNTSPEQFLSESTAVEEVIKDSNITFLQLEPNEIAAQLTLRDYCLFKSIESSEYIDSIFKKTSKYGYSHITKFIELSNEELFWVTSEILHESNIMKRAKIIKNFIQIADVCKECKNFNSLFAILSGLDHSSVVRLKETWDKVSSKYKKRLHELKAIQDPSFNMAKYRNLFKNELIQPPIIPFFPISYKDLFFTNEASQTVIDGLINFDKLRKLSKNVRSIVQMTTSSFDLTSMRDVPTSRSIIFTMFGCTNPSLIEFRNGATVGGVSGSYHQQSKFNIKADHIKKLYEESVMVRKVRHYLNNISKYIEKNEERLRLISSTLEHSTSGNTLKRRQSPNSSLGGSISSINALNSSNNLHNLSNGSSISTAIAIAGISSGNGTLSTHKNQPGGGANANAAAGSLFGTHSPDAVKKLLALSETKVKTVKNSSSSSSVPLAQLSGGNNSNNGNTSGSATGAVGGLSPTTPLSPKAKHRSISSSQPLNKYTYSIPLSSESSSVSTIKLNSKYNMDSLTPNPSSINNATNSNSNNNTNNASSSSSSSNNITSNNVNNSKKSAKSTATITSNPDKLTSTSSATGLVKSNTTNIIASIQQQANSEADSGRASMASNVDQDQCSPTFQQRAFILNRYLTNDQQAQLKSTNKVPIGRPHTEMLSNSMTKSQLKTSNEALHNPSNLEEEEDQVSAV